MATKLAFWILKGTTKGQGCTLEIKILSYYSVYREGNNKLATCGPVSGSSDFEPVSKQIKIKINPV